MDRNGIDCATGDGYQTSLYVWATAMSRLAEDRAMVDAGLKGIALLQGHRLSVTNRSLLRNGLIAYRATETEVWMPHHIALLAGACEVAGQIEDAVTLLDDALQVVERSGERLFVAELNRYKGQLLLRQGRPDAAEELYRSALRIAEEQEAKLWELRAAVSLARLCRDQGRDAEARDLLAPVYGWFTEGFDTADLNQAKALLDELA